MKPSKFFKAKVVSGYILIVAIFFVSICYVLQKVEQIASLDSDQTELQNKRSFINQTIFHLYQAEGYGQLAVVDPHSYTTLYRKALKTVRRDLDSLRDSAEKSGELSQTARIDSILNFLHLKEQSLANLNRTHYTGSLSELYNKTIEQIISRTDTAPEEEPAPGNIVIRKDTVRMAAERKSFFRRLANAFFPDKKDSVVLVASKTVVDSIPSPPISVADTITDILRDLQGNVNIERQKAADQIRAEIRNISYSNYLISRKINQLLLEFEQRETRRILDKIDLQNHIIRHSTYMLGIIASLAIVSMLLFVTIIWRDINRNNRYKQELEEANKYNRSLLEAREKLMMAITHDIKAPLSSITGYLDLLEGVTNPKRAELYINNMRESSGHLLKLVNTLLDFYRLETNKMDIQPIIFNPHRLFDAIYRGFSPVAQEKGIDLTCHSTAAADTFVVGDPLHIRQIADNLLSNAIKFTDRGRVSIELGLSEGTLHFSVSDTGKGMTEEERNKIFGEFVRLKSAQGVAGSGLGLSIVDRLVKLLKGDITVTSKPGEGSVFRVVIPVSPAPEGEPASTGPVTEPPAAGLPPLRCLLIDDDRFQLELAEGMCEKLGLIADICQFPEGVPELLAAHPYDIIFTDLQMPALTGFELLSMIRELPGYRNTPVVAISARADETREEFTAVLHKPFTLQELADIVRSVTRQKEKTDDPKREEEQKIDFGCLTAYAQDDENAANQILSSFAKEYSLNAETLRQAGRTGDMEAVRRVAHKMLPIFNLIDAGNIVRTLNKLEKYRGEPDAALQGEIENTADAILSITEKAEKEITLHYEENTDS